MVALERAALVAARGLAALVLALAEAQGKVMQVGGQVPIPAKYPAVIGRMRRRQRGNNSADTDRLGAIEFG